MMKRWFDPSPPDDENKFLIRNLGRIESTWWWCRTGWFKLQVSFCFVSCVSFVSWIEADSDLKCMYFPWPAVVSLYVFLLVWFRRPIKSGSPGQERDKRCNFGHETGSSASSFLFSSRSSDWSPHLVTQLLFSVQQDRLDVRLVRGHCACYPIRAWLVLLLEGVRSLSSVIPFQ